VRDLIQVGASQPKRSLDDLRKQRDAVAAKFSGYLRFYPAKTTRTRHGLLGPVAEIVKLAGKPGMTPGAAAGRALRMHEMAQDGRPVSKEATQALEDAAVAFFDLMGDCPVHLRRAVSDRILDHVYLQSRKDQQRFWDEFDAWLREKYKDDLQKLNEAWGAKAANGWRPLASWPETRKVKAAVSPGKKADLAEFRRSLAARGEVLPEPEDDEASSEEV
jgi:hypothetical protein